MQDASKQKKFLVKDLEKLKSIMTNYLPQNNDHHK